MQKRRNLLPILMFLPLFLAGCREQLLPAAIVEEPAALPTLMPTAAPAQPSIAHSPLPTATATETAAATAVAMLPPTFTPVATRRLTRTPAPDPAPTGAPAFSATVTTTTPAATLQPVPTPAVDRTCPNPPPLKPEYNRYYLSGTRWPPPDARMAEPHFWLSKPLPGGGRFLINQSFPYGWDGNGRLLLHNGVDSAEPLGTPVLAAADGIVIVAQPDMNAWYGWRCDWYGHLVVIEHDQRWFGQALYTLYGHVLNINVEAGQRVIRGEQVAEVGFGGAATAPHLHFEVRVGSNEFDATRNPMLWIDPGQTRGIIAGRLLDPEKRPWQGVALALLTDEGEVAASTWSYLDDPLHYINPDEGLAENFLFSDVRPGSYVLYTKLQGVEYRQPVSVTSGTITTVEIITEPFKTPTPEAE